MARSIPSKSKTVRCQIRLSGIYNSESKKKTVPFTRSGDDTANGLWRRARWPGDLRARHLNQRRRAIILRLGGAVLFRPIGTGLFRPLVAYFENSSGLICPAAEIKPCSLGLITNGAAAMKSYLNNPAHWRERAERTRAKAAWFWKDSEKQRMMRIADEYDRLADRAQRSVELLDKK
jgi:hypothetical protein